MSSSARARSGNRAGRRLKRLGLFGGTFDPIHNGHLRLAETARRELSLDRVVFLPARVPPHKGRPAASARDRWNMVRLALRGRRRFSASRYDLSRAPAYTVRTVRHFRKLCPWAEIYFLMGTDSLRELPRWRRVDEILSLCRIAAARRPSFTLRSVPRSVRRRLVWLRTPGLAVASRGLRERLRRGKSVSGLVPPAVARYIRERSLYAAA